MELRWRICWRLVGLVLIWICKLKTISTFHNFHPRSKTSRPFYLFPNKTAQKEKKSFQDQLLFDDIIKESPTHMHLFNLLLPGFSWIYSFLFTNICSKLVERTNQPLEADAPTLPLDALAMPTCSVKDDPADRGRSKQGLRSGTDLLRRQHGSVLEESPPSWSASFSDTNERT